METQFKAETETLAAVGDPLTDVLETVSLKPTKANIAVKLIALAWAPHWTTDGTSHPAYPLINP